MKKQALAISVALVLGMSANAFAGLTWSGTVDSNVVSRWVSNGGSQKAGDSVTSILLIDANVKGSSSGTSTDKTMSYSYSADMSSIMTDGAGKTPALAAYTAKLSDPLFTISAWGKKGNGGAKADLFDWLISNATKNAANTDTNNAKFRVETKTGWSLDIDNASPTVAAYDYKDSSTLKVSGKTYAMLRPTGWLFYNTKLGTADVGVGAATILKGDMTDANKTIVAFGKNAVTPKVTVQGEVGLSNGVQYDVKEITVNQKDGTVASVSPDYIVTQSKGLGTNGAAGAKVTYTVSDKLTTNAWASARGAGFSEYNTVQAGLDDRAEYGADATYVMGVTTVAASYSAAKHTAASYVKDGKSLKYDDDAVSSLSVKYAPTTGITGSLSYTVTTPDEAPYTSERYYVAGQPVVSASSGTKVATYTVDNNAGETAAKIAWAANASGKFLQDKLSVTANLKWSNDEDADIDPGNYYDTAGNKPFGTSDGSEIFGSQRYSFWRDANVTATYNYDANNIITATLQNVNVKADQQADYYVREYAKYTRKVDKGNVALEYVSTVYDNDQTLTDRQVQEAKTTLSFSVPF